MLYALEYWIWCHPLISTHLVYYWISTFGKNQYILVSTLTNSNDLSVISCAKSFWFTYCFKQTTLSFKWVFLETHLHYSYHKSSFRRQFAHLNFLKPPYKSTFLIFCFDSFMSILDLKCQDGSRQKYGFDSKLSHLFTNVFDY